MSKKVTVNRSESLNTSILDEIFKLAAEVEPDFYSYPKYQKCISIDDVINYLQTLKDNNNQTHIGIFKTNDLVFTEDGLIPLYSEHTGHQLYPCVVHETSNQNHKYHIYVKTNDGDIDTSKIYASGITEDSAWDDFESRQVWNLVEDSTKFVCVAV